MWKKIAFTELEIWDILKWHFRFQVGIEVKLHLLMRKLDSFLKAQEFQASNKSFVVVVSDILNTSRRFCILAFL